MHKMLERINRNHQEACFDEFVYMCICHVHKNVALWYFNRRSHTCGSRSTHVYKSFVCVSFVDFISHMELYERRSFVGYMYMYVHI